MAKEVRRVKKLFGKTLCLMIASVLAGSMLSGCGGKEKSKKPSIPTGYEEGTMENTMVKNSLVTTGNNYRMKKVIEKARAGEEVTVGFIGGSITQGYNAGTTEIFPKLTYDFFKADFAKDPDKIKYVNAGLSGTPSILGFIRSERDLLQYNPDIIFIEFAVNDGTDLFNSTGLENLIRVCLSQENEPAVVLLLSVIQSGYSAQDNMLPIAEYYEIPCISVKNAIWPFIENGEYDWASWSNDGSHPNADGCKLYADFIQYYFKTVDSENIKEPKEMPETLVKAFDLTGLKLVDREHNSDVIQIVDQGAFTRTTDVSSFNDGYGKSSNAEGSFKFTFTGKALYIVFKDTNDQSYGSAEVYVDGVKKTTLDGCSDNGWNNPETSYVMREKDSETHEVEIRMKEGQENKKFSILAFGIVE